MKTKHKRILFIFIAIVCFVLFYTISPLFIQKELDEKTPVRYIGEEPFVISEPAVVVGSAGHPAGGTVRVIQSDNKNIIRYEDFYSINGPNLHVYLANELDAIDYVDIGEVKATKGNINYEVPAHVDIKKYKYVMYWCVPFGVLFNYAEIHIE